MKTRIERDKKRRAKVLKMETARRICKGNMRTTQIISERLYWISVLDSYEKSSSRTRVTNRCSYTGRGKGKIKDWRMSRIQFREKALDGVLPGVQKASW